MRAEHGDIGLVVDLTVQSRVHQGNVVSLEVVVHVQLPVRRDWVVPRQHMLHALELKRCALRGQIGVKAVEGWCLRVQCREDHWSEHMDLHGLETNTGRIEGLRAIHLRSAQQLALQTVGPAVIATDYSVGVPAALGQWSGAMATDVEITAYEFPVAQE